ncbi:MAG TPA: branched-chain amino acid ABC transporter permease, partial [Acidimicrobiales bacterium]|nr:branched-chain amino acid ABC transporter permease [Acidimicrobiales bacterium]
DPIGMSALMAAAFAAVVAARLRSLPIAVGVSLLMGVVTDVIQKYLPPNSSFTAAIIPSIPFAFILLFLLFYVVRSGAVREERSGGGPLDLAIRPANDDPTVMAELASSRTGWDSALGAVPLVIVAAIPLFFHYVIGSDYWLGLAALGLWYAITMLTFTVVTGEGGMLWLSQIIFAGFGALGAAQFVTEWHVPVLLATVMAATIAAVVGAIIGWLTIRLGDLYVGLITFSFGLLIETLVFTRNRFLHGGLGLVLTPPKFARGTMAFSYLALAVFLVFAGLTWNMRRSTSGLALRAVRDSETASRMLGISVVQVKVIVGALAAFVAAVGGAFIAMDQQIAQPQYFATFAGLVWLAVVVTMGVRSINAAAIAGMSFALAPGVFQSYVPARWGEVPTMLFGLGAIGVARHPEGVVLQTARQIRSLLVHRHTLGALPLAGDEVARPLEGTIAQAGAAAGAAEPTRAAR